MQKINKAAISDIQIQTLLKRINQKQQVGKLPPTNKQRELPPANIQRELPPTNIQREDLTNDQSLSSSSNHCTDQYEYDKLLTEIRNGVQLRHVIPNEHKQCAKRLYDKTIEKLFVSGDEDKINEKQTKLGEQKTADIENILMNAMCKRRFVMRLESSSSGENINGKELENWYDADGDGDDE